MNRQEVSILLLRLGLAFVFLYAGIGSLTNPDLWIGYVPQWVDMIIDRDLFLMLHGIGEVALGIVLVLGLFLPIAAGLAALSLAGILLSYGIDAVTFRDVALVAMSAALAIQSWKSKE